jgi:hypothetical protein
MALKDLPSTLNDTYALLLQRIPGHDRSIARNAFTWLSFSIRRMTLKELAEAVVLEETDRDLDDDFRLTDPASVIEICNGLIQLEDGYVNLAHDSIRTCLMSEWITSSPVSEFRLESKSGHRSIMRKCLAYLLFDEFAKGHSQKPKEYAQRRRKYPLMDYAALCWPDHAANTELEREDEQLILDFFGTKSLPKGGSFDSWVQALLGTIDTVSIQRTQPLYYAASYNMIPIVKLLLRQGSDADINKRGGRYGTTPFAIACYRGHSEVAKLLLEAGADPYIRDGGTGETGLAMAMAENMVEIVEMVKASPTAGREVNPNEEGWEAEDGGEFFLEHKLLKLKIQFNSIRTQTNPALLEQIQQEIENIEEKLSALREANEDREEEHRDGSNGKMEEAFMIT